MSFWFCLQVYFLCLVTGNLKWVVWFNFNGFVMKMLNWADLRHFYSIPKKQCTYTFKKVSSVKKFNFPTHHSSISALTTPHSQIILFRLEFKDIFFNILQRWMFFRNWPPIFQSQNFHSIDTELFEIFVNFRLKLCTEILRKEACREYKIIQSGLGYPLGNNWPKKFLK
jgi:hypothetical protein